MREIELTTDWQEVVPSATTKFLVQARGGAFAIEFRFDATAPAADAPVAFALVEGQALTREHGDGILSMRKRPDTVSTPTPAPTRVVVTP